MNNKKTKTVRIDKTSNSYLYAGMLGRLSALAKMFMFFVTLHGKTDLADMIKDLKTGRLS